MAGLTLVAWDFDGVFNLFSKSAKHVERTTVNDGADDWAVTWRPDVIERARDLMTRPDVLSGWLSTWLKAPAALNEVETLLGLDGVMKFRAPYMTTPGAWGSVTDTRFAGATGDSPRRMDWWKFRSWELLLDDLKPSRSAWLDDDLGYASGKGAGEYKPRVTDDLFLYRTHDLAGLLHSDLDKLEAWLDS